MIKEGVNLPPSPESKPNSDPNAIPQGVKFTNDELVKTHNINFVSAADMCAAAASTCLRTDIGLMFLKFQTDKLSLGFKAKELMQKKGWLKVTPQYHQTGCHKANNQYHLLSFLCGQGVMYLPPVVVPNVTLMRQRQRKNDKQYE